MDRKHVFDHKLHTWIDKEYLVEEQILYAYSDD